MSPRIHGDVNVQPDPAITTHGSSTLVRKTTPVSPPRFARRRAPSAIAVSAIATGMIATLALPAYAFAPGAGGPRNESSATNTLSHAEAQQLDVSEIANTITVERDAYSATTEEELAAAKAAAAAEAAAAIAEAERAAIAEQFASYTASSGTSVSQFLSNPPYPYFDLGSVYSVAASYQGVPYVYGGASPGGFDCSGFVMYVYAQFGVSLPHSSGGQGAAGTTISEADAQPGDLVIMDGHDGFYAGNGMILHAPYEGASVRVQPIWTGSYRIVRIGI